MQEKLDVYMHLEVLLIKTRFFSDKSGCSVYLFLDEMKMSL